MLATIQKYIDLQTWNLTRVLRVGFGIAFVIGGIIGAEPFAATIGGFVLLQGLLNVGCGAACAVPKKQMNPEKNETLR